MNPLAEALEERTMRFALRVTQLCRALPASWEGRHVADQLFRSATGLAANYRASRRGRSHREFTAKLGTTLEEADETLFWLVFSGRSGMATGDELEYLAGQARELVAIFTTSVKTAIANQRPHQRNH